MAYFKTAWVVVKDFTGGTSRVTLSHIGDAFTMNEAKKFAEFIKDKSEAAVINYGITMTSREITETANDATEGPYDRVQQKLVLMYTDMQDNDKIRFTIPAPGSVKCVDKYQEPLTDLAEDVKDLIGNLTSRERGDLLYHGGGISGKVPRRDQRRSIETTGE